MYSSYILNNINHPTIHNTVSFASIRPIELIMATSSSSSSSSSQVVSTSIHPHTEFKPSLTRKGKKSDPYREFNALLRTIAFNNYPVGMFGKSPMKEMYETAFAYYATGMGLRITYNPDNNWGNRSPFYTDTKTLYIVPGDGINPRTAAIFAGVYGGQVLAIDPDMGGRVLDSSHIGPDRDVSSFINNKWGINHPNLKCLRGKVLPDGAVDVDNDKIDIKHLYRSGGFERVVIVCVHAHCDTKAMFDAFPNVLVYTMPCCMKSVQYLPLEYDCYKMFDAYMETYDTLKTNHPCSDQSHNPRSRHGGITNHFVVYQKGDFSMTTYAVPKRMCIAEGSSGESDTNDNDGTNGGSKD